MTTVTDLANPPRKLALLAAGLSALCALLSARTSAAESKDPRAAIDPRHAPPCEEWSARAVLETGDRRASLALLVSADGQRRRVRIDDVFAGVRVAGIAFDPRRMQPAVWLWDGARLCLADTVSGGGKRKVAARPRAEPTRAASAGASVATSTTASGARSVRVDRRELPQIMSELPALTRGVRVRPEVVDGNIQSVRLTGIRPGSFLERLGLADGDRITAIDGEPIGSTDRLMSLYSHLGKQDQWKVSVERRGVVHSV